MSAFAVARSAGGPAAVVVEQREVPPPGEGRVLIRVRAAGMNPYDAKRLSDPAATPPIRPGSEVAGIVVAVGAGAVGALGPLAVGQEVVAQPVVGGYAAEVVAKAEHVFPRPEPLSFAEAANLLLAGGVGAQLVAATGVGPGSTVLVHGASGGVGLMVLQLARLRGATAVIGTCGAANEELVTGFGAVPVRYGEGLEERVRRIAPGGVTAAIDCVGTAEAREVSFALVDDPAHAATIADFTGAFAAAGGRVLDGGSGSGERLAARAELIRLADEGALQVRVARTFPLAEVVPALELLAGGHPGGKLALIP